MYTLPPKTPPPVAHHILDKAIYISGAIVALAVSCYSISRFKRNSAMFVPEKIVELADMTKGLNKIKGFKSSVEELKNKILYPYKATVMGDKYFVKNELLKSGMVFAGDDQKAVHEVMNAFREHAKELSLRVVPCPYKKLGTKDSARNWVYKQFEEAQEHFKKTKEYTFLEIGHVDYLLNPKNSKDSLENARKMGEFLEKNVYDGVFWSGWTNNTKQWPFFLENPILVTKLVD